MQETRRERTGTKQIKEQSSHNMAQHGIMEYIYDTYDEQTFLGHVSNVFIVSHTLLIHK